MGVVLSHIKFGNPWKELLPTYCIYVANDSCKNSQYFTVKHSPIRPLMEAHYGFCEAGTVCSHTIRFNSVFEMLVEFNVFFKDDARSSD